MGLLGFRALGGRGLDPVADAEAMDAPAAREGTGAGATQIPLLY